MKFDAAASIARLNDQIVATVTPRLNFLSRPVFDDVMSALKSSLSLEESTINNWIIAEPFKAVLPDGTIASFKPTFKENQ
jgi:hypothetical protein